jgi:hypothetical protein
VVVVAVALMLELVEMVVLAAAVPLVDQLILP